MFFRCLLRERRWQSGDEQWGHCIAMLTQFYLECVFKLAKVSTNEFKENCKIDKPWKRFKEGMVERNPKMFAESTRQNFFE